MSDRSSAKIIIGGQLPSALLPLLEKAFEEDGYEELDLDDNKTHRVTAYAPEITNGEFYAVEAFCEDQGLSFIRESGSGDEYDAEVVYWVPGMKEKKSLSANFCGEPVLPLPALLEIQNAGGSIATAISELKLPECPIFELVDDETKVSNLPPISQTELLQLASDAYEMYESVMHSEYDGTTAWSPEKSGDEEAIRIRDRIAELKRQIEGVI